jgi:membrane protease YdiL (CAAX protease family)
MGTTSVRHPRGLTLFFAVTFTTSWMCWLIAIMIGGSATAFPTVIPYLIGGFGPAIGACAVRVYRASHHGPTPAHTVRLRLSPRLGWVLPSLVLGSATVLVAALSAHLLGDPTVGLGPGARLVQAAGGPVPLLVGLLVLGPLAEEPGWRGTAYPRMRDSMSRFQAGMALGAIWAAWHLPLFLIHGTAQAALGLFSWSGLLFVLTIFPMTFLTGYAYERAGVAASIAVHFSVNATMALLNAYSPVTQGLFVVVQGVLAMILLARQRDRQMGFATHSISLPAGDFTRR